MVQLLPHEQLSCLGGGAGLGGEDGNPCSHPLPSLFIIPIHPWVGVCKHAWQFLWIFNQLFSQTDFPTLPHKTPWGSMVSLSHGDFHGEVFLPLEQGPPWSSGASGGMKCAFSHRASAGPKPCLCLAETCFWGFCGNFFKSKCQRVILGWGFHNSLLPKMPSQGAESIPCYLTSLCGSYQPVAGSRKSLPPRGCLAVGANNQHPGLPRCWKSLTFFPCKSLMGCRSFVNSLCFLPVFGLNSRTEHHVCIQSDNSSQLLLEKGEKKRGMKPSFEGFNSSLLLIGHVLLNLFFGAVKGCFLRSVAAVLTVSFKARTENCLCGKSRPGSCSVVLTSPVSPK